MGLAERDDADSELSEIEGDAADALGHLRKIPRGSPDALEAKLNEIGTEYDDDPIVSAALNAYRSILEFDRGAELTPRDKGVGQAAMELEELQNGAVRFDVARAVAQLYLKRFRAPEQINRVDVLLRGPGKGDSDWRDDQTSDLQIIPKPGADTTLVVFCDFRHRFNMMVNTFYHIWISSLPANIIFLRDWERLLYMLGVDSIGDQKETVAEIKRLSNEMGAKRIVTAGNSGGGFGALEYAIYLEADACLAFAPPVDLNYTVSSVRRRMRTKITNRLVEFRDVGQIAWPDMPKLYRERPGTRAEIFYAEGNDVDRTHAERMSGLPNVKLSMIEGATAHGLLRQLAAQGGLESAFRDAMQ